MKATCLLHVFSMASGCNFAKSEYVSQVGTGDLCDLPDMRLHDSLLVHATPAGRQSQQSRVLAAVGADPALDSV